VFRVAVAIIAVAALVGLRGARQTSQSRTPFAAQIAALSETAGFFDTDNLISNERSYLEVLPELDKRSVHGGAYVGVGPDQNFSYIAHVRPSIAFILDIRRDNLLLHLLFKALFEQAHTRIEYLALLFGRPLPADVSPWREAPIERLVAYINGSSVEPKSVDELRARLDRIVNGFGVPLTSDDLATIDGFHRRFIESGLELRFQSFNRPSQSYYPTYQELLSGTDTQGRQGNYLATEEAFQFVKSLQERDRIIPVIGNLSGPSALVAIGRAMTDKGETLSAFYASNVEFYLERDGSYSRFVANLGRLPHTNRSVIIRSIFNRGIGGSMSVIQPVEELLAQFGR
jgi:hypothetical protein